ncbi:hypothetical protein AOX55_00003411 [Sinorhizobium fredii CCBAU 25509]|nr:hypothetical protein AOX55_00003411 [Sinorhizobium fredii CCBAU 25509]
MHAAASSVIHSSPIGSGSAWAICIFCLLPIKIRIDVLTVGWASMSVGSQRRDAACANADEFHRYSAARPIGRAKVAVAL